MFTGIVEEIGRVRSVSLNGNSAVLEIYASKVLEGTIEGDSIATSGVCLTVTSVSNDHFTADVMPETYRRTTLGRLSRGASVNLERAMKAGGRMGGHIVTGHVDACGRVISAVREGNAVLLSVSVPQDMLRYIAEKGSVTVDGVSLTVVEAGKDSFTVSMIPHTGSVTTLGLVSPGTFVNIEVDVVARYIERLLSFTPPVRHESSLTMEFLKENGF